MVELFLVKYDSMITGFLNQSQERSGGINFSPEPYDISKDLLLGLAKSTMSGCIETYPSKFKPLPVDLDYVTDELSMQAQSELNEDDNTRLESLRELKAMLEKEEGLRWQDDDLFLLVFLRARKFDVHRAFNLIKSFYTSFGKRDRIFYRLKFDDFLRIMEENSMYFLPHRDPEGSVVVCFRVCAWDPIATNAEEYLVLFSLGLMQALRSPSTQIAGFQMIADFKGLGFSHLLHATPSVLFSLAEILQNTIPMRVKGIHVVNENAAFGYIWKIAKRLMSKKLRERVHMHGKDFKSLHKFIPRNILPADLGGVLPPFDNTDWRERMEDSEDYVRHVCSHGYVKYLNSNRRRSSVIKMLSSCVKS